MLDLVVIDGDVVVLVVQASLDHVGQILGACVGLNGVQCQLDARHNHGILGVEKFGADNDLVIGD